MLEKSRRSAKRSKASLEECETPLSDNWSYSTTPHCTMLCHRSTSSLRSKRFRVVLERRTRNESKRPHEKWGEIWVFGSRSIFRAAKTKDPVPCCFSVFLCSETKRRRLPRKLINQNNSFSVRRFLHT